MSDDRPIVHKKKKRMKWIMFCLGVVAVITVGYFYMHKDDGKSQEPVSVEATVSRGDLVIGFESDGQASIPYSNLDFTVSGTLKELHVKAGDKVTAGQVLAMLDDKDLKRTRDLAALAYEKAKLTYRSKDETQTQTLETDTDKVAGLKNAMNILQKDYDRMVAVSDYYAQSEIDAKKQALDDAVRAYDLAASQLKATRSSTTTLALEKLNVETSKIQLDTANEDLNNVVLKAPAEGTILEVNGDIGDKMSEVSGASTLTSDTDHFIIFTPSDAYEIITTVSEQDISMVTLGQKVEVTFDAIGNKVHEGSVTKISALPTVNSSGVVSYELQIRLKAGYEDIRVGMTATAKIIQKQETDALIIPNKAVKMGSGKQTVQVKKDDGTLEVKTIKTGLTDGRNVVVTSGLEQGEVVVYETSSTNR